ncbi:MAG: hypothetical protein JWP25_4 [Bradyrhizobium sp.]|nr:hypothetical protein [Bradyrhizobium sp.]
MSLKILFGLVLSGSLDPSDYAAFQAVFGKIFTVIIALEFKKSLLVVAERRDTLVQIRSVVMIALLAVCRKVIILDLSVRCIPLAFAAAILALGAVYWLMRDSDQRLDVGHEDTRKSDRLTGYSGKPAVPPALRGLCRIARCCRSDRPA